MRNRIVEHVVVAASELRRNPKNWRKHPDRQVSALTAVLNEIGFVDEAIAVRDDDGSLLLIDGHARQQIAEAADDAEIPVAVTDLDQRERDIILAAFDSITDMAKTDTDALVSLLAGIERNDQTTTLLDAIAAQSLSQVGELQQKSVEYKPLYQVVVECKDERDQRVVFEQLQREGKSCRLLML